MRTSAVYAALFALFLSNAVVAHEGEEHGNHDAMHGGFVMMYGDLHFELVAKATGDVALYYSDAARAPLPAATATDVVVEVERTNGATDNVSMSISDDGAAWVGVAQPFSAPEDIVRVGFVFEGEPLVLDIPFSAMPIQDAHAATADAHHAH